MHSIHMQIITNPQSVHVQNSAANESIVSFCWRHTAAWHVARNSCAAQYSPGRGNKQWLCGNYEQQLHSFLLPAVSQLQTQVNNKKKKEWVVCGWGGVLANVVTGRKCPHGLGQTQTHTMSQPTMCIKE